MSGLPEREGTLDAEEYFARIHPDDRGHVLSAFDDLVGSPDHTAVAFTHRLIQPDGSTSWASSHGELVRDHRDAPPRFVVVSLDISDAKRREEELAAALAERDRLLEQKEALLVEVNHRVKNSLQLVLSILNTDARRAGTDQVRDRLEQAAARVRAVTSVHEMLYRSSEIATVELGTYLGDLCLSLAAGSSAPGVEIACGAAQVRLPIDTAIPLALIVNELVSNALKHAFAGAGGGRIQVSTRLEGGALVLEVADNGAGKHEGANAGLGTRIVQGLVKQLHASLTESDAAPGYRVVIRVPVADDGGK
jgi:two-component sensor histidine kinase